MKKQMSKNRKRTKAEEKETLTPAYQARVALEPSCSAALTMASYSPFCHDVQALTNELSTQNDRIIDGNLGCAERMLFDQANVLQAIFTNLSQRAIQSEYIKNLDQYLRLALKAQAQCTRTLEVLGELKNPSSVAFVRQANIGHAVQVNNAPSIRGDLSHAQAQETLNRSNELLEVQHGNRLDTRTTSSTISIDSQMESVEQVNRS
jgi:transcriptional regulator NrdR family protein